MKMEINHSYKLSHLRGYPPSSSRLAGRSSEELQSCRTAADLEDDKWHNVICTQSVGLEPGFFLFLTHSEW